MGQKSHTWAPLRMHDGRSSGFASGIMETFATPARKITSWTNVLVLNRTFWASLERKGGNGCSEIKKSCGTLLSPYF